MRELSHQANRRTCGKIVANMGPGRCEKMHCFLLDVFSTAVSIRSDGFPRERIPLVQFLMFAGADKHGKRGPPKGVW